MAGRLTSGSNGSAGYGDMTKGAKAKKGKPVRIVPRETDGSANDKRDSGTDGGGKMPMKTAGPGRKIPGDTMSRGGGDGTLANEDSLYAPLKGKRF